MCCTWCHLTSSAVWFATTHTMSWFCFTVNWQVYCRARGRQNTDFHFLYELWRFISGFAAIYTMIEKILFQSYEKLFYEKNLVRCTNYLPSFQFKTEQPIVCCVVLCWKCYNCSCSLLVSYKPMLGTFFA